MALFGAWSLFSLAPLLRAAVPSGSIIGTVSDSTTAAYLEGAEVQIQGTSSTGATDRNGRFELRDVPAGTQQVVVAYPGLPRGTITVEITSGQTVNASIRLGSEVVHLSEFRVGGAIEGMAKAIALQKASSESRIVAASDQFGDILNGNVADYLKFLPGIGVDYSADDARALSREEEFGWVG